MFKYAGKIVKAGALALGLVFLATPASAEPTWDVGNRGTVGAYCEFDNERDIEAFVSAVESGGMESYKALMASQLPCYDARMHRNIGPTGVELVEYYRDITYRNGNGGQSTVEIWKIKDARGGIGYTWLPKKDSLPPPGQPT